MTFEYSVEHPHPRYLNPPPSHAYRGMYTKEVVNKGGIAEIDALVRVEANLSGRYSIVGELNSYGAKVLVPILTTEADYPSMRLGEPLTVDIRFSTTDPLETWLERIPNIYDLLVYFKVYMEPTVYKWVKKGVPDGD